MSTVWIALACLQVAAGLGQAANNDWSQFRGPGAQGKSEARRIPLTWSDQTNIQWKASLPGPGASSPIILGNRIFLTCYTGYATSSREPGEMSALKRHVLCVNLEDGKILWNTDVPAVLPEQDRIRESHGYASSTPVVDGERVIVFFGKSGVLAFDLEGKKLWHTDVGDKLNGWGSAAPLTLYKDMVLVNACIESESLIALDRKTGKEVWRAGGVKESWHAPVLLDAPGGQTEIVLAMLGKILGFDADTGKELWRAKTGISWYMCPTPVTEKGVVYSIGGRNPNGGLAVRAGGRGDVTESHLVWKVNRGSNVPSPILEGGHLYFAHENLGVVYCVNAATGELVFEERLNPSPGQIYASPVLAGGRIYFVGRGGRTVVIAARPSFEQLGDNTLEGNRGVFNASPAIAGERLLLRSNRALYCIAN